MAAVSVDATDGRFALETCESIASQGYAILDFKSSASTLSALQEETNALASEDGFVGISPELLPGILGTGCARICYLPSTTGTNDAVMRPVPGLQADVQDLAALDLEFSELAMLLDTVALDTLHCSLIGRSPAVVLEAGSSPLDAEPNVGQSLAWLNLFRVQRLLVLVFIGPGEGTLELHPEDAEAATLRVEAKPGTWIVLRPDILERNFRASGSSRAVACWFLGEARREGSQLVRNLETFLSTKLGNAKQTAESEDAYRLAVSRQAQRAANHAFHAGMQVGVRGMSCHFPSASCADDWWAMAVEGGDVAVTVPLSRWDVAACALTPEDFQAYGASKPFATFTYTTHGVFIEGAELFDNKFFGISLAESRGMDPNQHHLLECAYEAFHTAGLNKQALIRKWCGIYTAASFPEWLKTETDTGGEKRDTSASLAITSNRLSYALGLTGPNFAMNVEGAGSLLAMTIATDTVQPGRNQNDSAMALGSDLILAAIKWWEYSTTGRMSAAGRCFTFDASSDGFIRGEGCGAAFVEPLAPEGDGSRISKDKQILAVIDGAHSANVGKAAKLGAPSAAADVELISDTVLKAGINALDVDALECYGIGNAMHDTVEVMAASRAYRNEFVNAGGEVLALTALKSGVGFAVPAAGMQSIFKVVGMMQSMVVPSSLHLRRLNPVLDLGNAAVIIASENTASRLSSSSFVGITAKGWGGTSAHIIMWGQRLERLTQPAAKQEAIAFWPAGGGDLPGRSKPRKGYYIAGSWNNFEPILMEPDAKGVHKHRLILSEDGFASFHILLDGDTERVLHPGHAEGARGGLVLGPDSSVAAGANGWIIDGRTTYMQRQRFDDGVRAFDYLLDSDATDAGDALVPVSSLDQGLPGDSYEVSVCISGKYRMVTWSRVETQQLSLTE
mmetsp:Transcript_29945/g.54545  ORF Transcript_29945/g.54545 Transcript_29945/m.54545 type:complete len:905 (-) Transcript_29945:110-2824(-)